MIQAFYSAALGAQQQMTRMGVQGNNISNVNTYGYKAEKPSFEAALYRYEDGVDGAQLPRGSGALMVSTATDFAASSIEQTGRSLDYTIVGDGFFALRDPATGEVSYTRDGSFTLSVSLSTDRKPSICRTARAVRCSTATATPLW